MLGETEEYEPLSRAAIKDEERSGVKPEFIHFYISATGSVLKTGRSLIIKTAFKINYYIFFRILATGISSCSLYFAMVLQIG
jgi:hypothetical protein